MVVKFRTTHSGSSVKRRQYKISNDGEVVRNTPRCKRKNHTLERSIPRKKMKQQTMFEACSQLDLNSKLKSTIHEARTMRNKKRKELYRKIRQSNMHAKRKHREFRRRQRRRRDRERKRKMKNTQRLTRHTKGTMEQNDKKRAHEIRTEKRFMKSMPKNRVKIGRAAAMAVGSRKSHRHKKRRIG